MTTYLLSGVVSGPSGFLNGAQVTAYDESLFINSPAAGDTPPVAAVLGTNAFNTDGNGNVVLSGTGYGGNGQWQIEVANNHGYYIGVLYPVGSTTAQYYWSYDDSLIQSRGLQGPQGFQGNQGYQGFNGVQGTQGFQGTTGATGSQGTQGTQGRQGFQGVQGGAGVQGSTGATCLLYTSPSPRD